MRAGGARGTEDPQAEGTLGSEESRREASQPPASVRVWETWSCVLETARAAVNAGLRSRRQAKPEARPPIRTAGLDIADIKLGPKIGGGSFGTVFSGQCAPAKRVQCVRRRSNVGPTLRRHRLAACGTGTAGGRGRTWS